MSWLDKLLNYFREKREEKLLCQSCEVLKFELNMMRIERDKLLDKIINPVTSPQEIVKEPINKVMLPRHHKNWKIRQQELEANDRRTNVLKMELDRTLSKVDFTKKVETPEELEKEILKTAKEN